MFDKNSMRLIKVNQIGEYLLKNEQVFMVMIDGSLREIQGSEDMEEVFFHFLLGGSFVVYKKKFELFSNFTQTLKLGPWSFTIAFEKEGDEKADVEVLDAGEEC